MDEVIALGDNGVLVPLGDVDFDGVAFGDDPLLSLRVDDDALAVLDDDAAAAFVVDHGVVHGGGMHVALVTADGPLAVLGEFAAPVLDAGVVAGLLDLGVEDEVLHFTAAPDQKLIVAELFRAGGLAGDRAVFDGPEFLVGVPVGEVFAVEERAEAVIGGVQGKGAQEEGEKQSGFHGAIGLGCVPPLLLGNRFSSTDFKELPRALGLPTNPACKGDLLAVTQGAKFRCRHRARCSCSMFPCETLSLERLTLNEEARSAPRRTGPEIREPVFSGCDAGSSQGSPARTARKWTAPELQNLESATRSRHRTILAPREFR